MVETASIMPPVQAVQVDMPVDMELYRWDLEATDWAPEEVAQGVTLLVPEPFFVLVIT
jgi:hypothetical protein